MNLADKHNSAALREALKTVKRYFDGYTVNVPEMRRQVDAALAAPPRNCDVGTAEEQAKRMDAFCASHRERIGGSWRCDNCLLCSIHRCDLTWAQMPYVEKEGGDK